MINNDILQRIQHTFNFSNKKIQDICLLADGEVSTDQIAAWLKTEGEAGYLPCTDVQFATFLNGLINDKRGKIHSHPIDPEIRLTNNRIMMKLKISLNLKADEVIDLMELSGCKISKRELSAFFRNITHKHYRPCNDQILLHFLNGMQRRYQPS